MESLSPNLEQFDVLIVDDTPANLRLLSQILQDEMYTVRAALDGPSALKAVDSALPDLILLDIGLPDMDGFEVCEKIKSNPITASVPIIFISALDSPEDKVKALNAGGVDYITKPFNNTEVLTRVRIHATIQYLQNRLIRMNTDLEEQVKERTKTLQETNDALTKFLPDSFLKLLGKENVRDVSLGDSVLHNMTSLFCDIRRFTTRAEKLGPEKTFEFLNQCFGKIVPAITANKGIVDNYLGDGLMALFPTDPKDALAAGIKIIKAIDDFNTEKGLSGDERVSLGLGMNWGPCMLGFIGDEERIQGTVIADTVNVASRIESLTKEYRVSFLVSGDFLQALGDSAEFPHRFVNKVFVRGRSKEVSLYEIFSNEPPETIQERIETNAQYKEALDDLEGANREEAWQKAMNLVQDYPGDPLYRSLLERAEERRKI
jgi:two-component system sensor histidine kinase ChiS